VLLELCCRFLKKRSEQESKTMSELGSTRDDILILLISSLSEPFSSSRDSGVERIEGGGVSKGGTDGRRRGLGSCSGVIKD
jgi:hypothetical protein